MSIYIQPAGMRDTPALARIHETGFAHAWDESALRRLMDKPNCLTLAAFDSSSALIGFIMTMNAADEAEILTIATDPKRRRKGVAAALLIRAIELSRLRGAHKMFLEVASGNKAALSLYAKHGFTEVGRRSGYYQQGRTKAEDAIVMARNLND